MSSLLPSIQSPEDLKKLSIDQLPQLAQEIRELIISVMSINGGHLASNLGSVELSLALHYVFSSPTDQFLWDVSHQTYTHKLLTGRQDKFSQIRKYRGLCGFSNPNESPHDHFHAGHAGTALSLALGLSKTRDLSHENNHVIPIIGDATLTCGTALEALNNMSRKLKRFVVILNDNAMSISKNVGAITKILSRILNHPTSNRIYHELETFVSKVPGFGTALAKKGQRLTESLKNLVSPAVFFEQYGLSYVGPIDGHNVQQLIDTFNRVKNADWPIVLHINTVKGHSLKEATKNPTTWHGAAPFNVKTCTFYPNPSPKPNFPKIFGDQILKMADQDPDIVVVTPAMSKGSCLDPMMDKYPQRCLDVGIAESHCVTFCGGLAYKEKKKVVCSIYGTFLQRALDNLFHDVCLQKIPVVFAIDRAGFSAADGCTHHGIYDISFLRSMPNMIIAQPRNGHVLRELLISAFDWKKPTAIRYPKVNTEDPNLPLQKRQIGKGELLAKGKELLLVALGHMNTTALQVKELFAQQGIKISVLDPVFVKPLDEELLNSLLKDHPFIVTIEEHSLPGGLGAAVNQYVERQRLTNSNLQVQLLNLGVPEYFVEQGGQADLIQEIGLTPDQIYNTIQQTFSWTQTTPDFNQEKEPFHEDSTVSQRF